MVPLVWKLVYVDDISAALHREMGVLEDGLAVFRGDGQSVAERFAALQENVMETRMRKFGYEPIRQGDFFTRQEVFQRYILEVLASRYDAGDADTHDRRIARTAKLIRQRRTELRGVDSAAAVAERAQLKLDAELAEEAKRLGEFTREVYGAPTLTQEHVGESLKRMRDRLLTHTKAQRLANMLPRPFGARIAYVGVPEPVRVESVPDDDKPGYERRLLIEMRASMQERLDAINESIEPQLARFRVANLLLEQPQR
jgi:hypothetical protein